MAVKEDKYEKALQGKKIPVLTLDNKWYKLFNKMEPDKKLKALEEELNDLLKRQGKLNTESKSIKKIKKNLLDGIVQLMEKEDQASIKKIEENRRLVEECNEKLEEYQDELLDLPAQIDRVNKELMFHTMEMCYQVLQVNHKDIEEIGQWIDNVRVELKKNVVRKQDKEIQNHELYSYMHDIFGADVIEIFDMKYHISSTDALSKAGKKKVRNK